MANKRFIDFPIATTVGDNDIILIWQGGANKQTTKATILSGVPDSLNDLTDVTISGLTNGQILRYDSVTGQWENTDQGNLDLNDLNDVTIVSPTNGQVLVYNSSTGKWENSSGGYVPYVGAVTTVNLGAQSIQAGSFVKQGGTASQFLKADGSVDSTAYGTGSVTSVGLTMPAAFNVANSPITTSGTLAVTGAGTVGQYIRGDGSLADFPQTSGGGSSVSYYLNGSVDQGTIGGIAYKELSKVPILGAGTDFTINADGYIASFITDAGDPSLLEIPGGNWNFETYFSASSSGGTPTFYVELYKVSGTTATLIASSSSAPELIAFGTNLTPYFSTLAVPTTTLALTDRLAVRYYVTHSGRTITLHTENNHLCQIVTTFTTGITALNGLTAQVQNFAVGTTGTDFNIASATATHTFNLPTASATNRGALSSADWSTFNAKQNALTLTTTGTSGAATLVGATLNIPQYQAALTNPVTGTGSAGQVAYWSSSSEITGESNLFWDSTNDRLGIGVNNPVVTLNVGHPNHGLGVAYLGASSLPAIAGLFTDSSSAQQGFGSLLIKSRTDFANYSINFYTASTANVIEERMRIFSQGQVHIGPIPSLNNGGTLQVTGTAIISSNVTANSFIKSGGTSSQYLMADGSVSTLTNPVTGTGNNNYIAKFTSTGSTVGNSLLQSDSNNVFVAQEGTSLGLDAQTNIRLGFMKKSGLAPLIAYATDSFVIASSSGANIFSTNSFTPRLTIDINGLATFSSSVTATSFIRSGGTSSQYLMADGSVSTLSNHVTGTGVSGRVTYWNGTNSITSDADLLFNGSELNVSGIKIDGSSVPYIVSTLAGNDLNIQFPVGQGLNLGNNAGEGVARIIKNNITLYNGASTIQTSTGNLTISTGGGNGNIILSPNGNGAVGIGVTPSSWSLLTPLQIKNVAFAGYTSGTNHILYAASNFYYDGVDKYITNGAASLYSQFAGQHYWYSAPTNSSGAGAALTFTEQMRLFSDGNLLLQSGGTFTNNGVKLQVNGAGGIRVNEDGSGTKVISIRSNFAGVDPAVNVATNNSLLLMTNNTERMQIFSGGNVHIGPTPVSDNGARLQVSGTSTFSNIITANSDIHQVSTGGLYWGAPSTYVIGVTGNTANGNLSFITGSTVKLTIASTGAATFSSTIRSNNTYGLGIGDIAGYRRIQYDLANTRFGLLTDGNALANLEAAAATFSSSVTAALDSSFNGVNVGRGGGSISQNTILGTTALNSNTTGTRNTAVGFSSLQSNTTGSQNTGIGNISLRDNTTGTNNTSVGYGSMTANTTGNSNTGFGHSSLASNTSGTNNSAVGLQALGLNTTGSNNTAIGFEAGFVTNGSFANNTSTNSVYIGSDTRASASGNTNEIVIGSGGRGQGSNSAVIGNSSITKTILRGNVLIGTETDLGSSAGTLQVNGKIYNQSGHYTTGRSLAITALNTNFNLLTTAYSGLIVIRDNTNGGSALWLADPNQGFIQISNNMPGTWVIAYSAPNTVIRKTSGNLVNISFAFYGNELY